MMNLDARLKSKWWRLTHLYKIKNKQGELVTFKPNYVQLKHLAERGSHGRNLILKARQFGFTTLYCIDYLDEAIWVPGMTCAILAHERIASDKIFEIVKRAYENMPADIKPKAKTDTKREYHFTENYLGMPLDSSIYVALKIRSGTVQKLHVTESARIKDRMELVSGSKQAVPISGSITEETTGNGFEDFYDIYMENYQKPPKSKLDYRTYFYAWFENPEYTLPGTLVDKTKSEFELQNKYGLSDGQLLWRRWKINDMRLKQEGIGLTGEQLFKQEYPSNVQEAFQSGAGSVFDQEKLSDIDPVDPLPISIIIEMLAGNEEKINKAKALNTLGLNIWEVPDITKRYVIGVDPSDGAGSDNSCIDVWELDGLKQVAQFYGKLRPDELAELAAEIGYFYNGSDTRGAFVGIENNMLTTILMFSKIYENYYFETRIDERTAKKTKKIGWSTNIKTRDVMIDEFNIFFDEGHLTIRSKMTINEMRTFIRDPESGKREHAVGKHDDSLFAAFIAIQMRKFYRQRARVFANKPF